MKFNSILFAGLLCYYVALVQSSPVAEVDLTTVQPENVQANGNNNTLFKLGKFHLYNYNTFHIRYLFQKSLRTKWLK